MSPHFVTATSSSKRKDLMTKANAKNGLSLGQDFLHAGDGGLAHAGVSWSIAQEQTVEFVLAEIVVPGDDVHPGSTFQETSKLIVFQTTVHDANSRLSTGVEGVYADLEYYILFSIIQEGCLPRN